MASIIPKVNRLCVLMWRMKNEKLFHSETQQDFLIVGREILNRTNSHGIESLRERERERWQDEAEEESQSGAINAIMKTANREREREREANALIHHVAVMLCECHVNVIQFVMELATTKANSQTWQWHNTNNNNNNTKQARPPSSRKKEEQ